MASSAAFSLASCFLPPTPVPTISQVGDTRIRQNLTIHLIQHTSHGRFVRRSMRAAHVIALPVWVDVSLRTYLVKKC